MTRAKAATLGTDAHSAEVSTDFFLLRPGSYPN